jgi:hypothetical protein
MEEGSKEKPHCVQMCLILEHGIEKGKKLILFLLGEGRGLKKTRSCWFLEKVPHPLSPLLFREFLLSSSRKLKLKEK